ncbi:hypothetical protein DPMN_047893 [Dreissena polymorpha]|uniref:SET domain-containing protein n=1 Tax=Dreissena polymorpha TaxID=45954 RepID=A0A9D4I1W7_DREPO|nr:hypothetical protein DPMN_047893 [Dreissena polymorpha]
MRMTRTQKSPILAASNKYKTKKHETERSAMESDTESESAIIKRFDSTTQTSVNTMSVGVSVETLNADQFLDNSVCVKVETDECYNTATVYYSSCSKQEQIPSKETHPDYKKQDGFNIIHEQTGCLRMDQDYPKQAGFTSECVKSEQTEVMQQDVTPRQAWVNSLCVNKNKTVNSNAYTVQDELHSVCRDTKQSLNLYTDQSYITTNDPNSVCGRDIQDEKNDTDNGNRTANHHNSVYGKAEQYVKTNTDNGNRTANDHNSVYGKAKQYVKTNTDDGNRTANDHNYAFGTFCTRKAKQYVKTNTDNGNRTATEHNYVFCKVKQYVNTNTENGKRTANSVCGKILWTHHSKTPDILHVQTAPSSCSGSGSLLQNMMTVNSADQHLRFASNSSLLANGLACTSNVETMPTYQLSPSHASKEADDRLLLQSWYALPSENHNDHSINGSVIDVKPVHSTLDTYTLHGNGQHGCIFSPSSGILPFVLTPSLPPVEGRPTDPAQEGNIPLPSSSSQSTQPQYNQQQQQLLVTTVKTPQCGAMAEPVFDEKQDTGDQNLEENKLLVLNEWQLSLFGSKEVCLDFENGNLMPSLPHSSSDLTPTIHFASKAEANLLCTLPVQDLPTTVSIPSAVGSSVTCTNAGGERACKLVKKAVPINQPIGLSRDVTKSIDQKVGILPLNAPHVPMPLISCDSNSNQSQGNSSSYSNGMSLSVSSKMAEFAVTSEINSNLAAESVESSDDDCVEIFIGRNKRKRNSHQSTHPSPKRVRDQCSSRGVAQPTGASTRVNAATQTVTPFLKAAKVKLDGKRVQVKKVERLKNATSSEKDKTEFSLQERNPASCMNLEPPDKDHFLYCGECNKEFKGCCPVHGIYNYIQDKEVPEGDPLKADHTLPDCLEIKTSKIAGAGLGVFSKVGLVSRIIFGPYGGDIVTENHKSGYGWQIYKEGKASHFMDAQNKATSNWMRYVNCPMN